jgi:hypothetical protein
LASAGFASLGRRGARLAGRVVLFDRVGDRGFGGDHRFDRVSGHELDVVHREHVGRIGHRDRERAAGAAEGDDLILARGVGGNELDDGRVDLELREVDGGDAVLLAEQRGDLIVLDEAHLDEVVAELSPVGFLLGQGLAQLLRGDQFLLEKELAYTNSHETPRLLDIDNFCQY